MLDPIAETAVVTHVDPLRIFQAESRYLDESFHTASLGLAARIEAEKIIRRSMPPEMRSLLQRADQVFFIGMREADLHKVLPEFLADGAWPAWTRIKALRLIEQAYPKIPGGTTVERDSMIAEIRAANTELETVQIRSEMVHHYAAVDTDAAEKAVALAATSKEAYESLEPRRNFCCNATLDRVRNAQGEFDDRAREWEADQQGLRSLPPDNPRLRVYLEANEKRMAREREDLDRSVSIADVLLRAYHVMDQRFVPVETASGR